MEKESPKYTVISNLVSPESNRWVGTSWEFFDCGELATRCFQRHITAGNCPTKRPFHPNDEPHLGAAHRMA